MVLFFFVGCGGQDDIQAIHELIETGARQAEAHQIGDLLDMATSDFVATPGHYNRSTTRGIVYRAFKYYGNFRIHYPRPSIQIDEHTNSSRVTMYFVLVRQDIDIPGLRELADDPRQWIETARGKADLYQLKLALAKMDKTWRVRQAHVEGFKGTGF
jgi:hypothetical protein